MHLVELTEYLIKSIVKNKDISVKKFDDLEDAITIQVLVDNDDMGVVIGKDGKTLRIDLPGNNGNIIKFHLTEEEKAALQPNGETWFATVIATCDVNEWNNN